MEDFPNEIRYIYRHFPIMFDTEGEVYHDKAGLAVAAAEAAGIQGLFWEMHDLLYAKQEEWQDLTPETFTDWLVVEAEMIGLDIDLFLPDLVGETLTRYAEETYLYGLEFGLPGTPFLLVDNRPLEQQYYSYAALNTVFDNWLIPLGKLSKQHFDGCPEMTIDLDAHYTATLKTEKGDIVIALYSDIAPFAVNNFIFLAENDFYDNVTFHRVLEGFVAQGGDPSGTGGGNAGYFFTVEASQELIFDRPGLVAYANVDPTTNSSQFFIIFREAAELNGNYTIFGEVIEGMDVALSLTLRNPQDGFDLPPGDLILDVEINKQ